MSEASSITEQTIRIPYLTTSELHQIIRINQAVGLQLMNSAEIVRDSTPEEAIKTIVIEKWSKENPPENGFICYVGEVEIFKSEVFVTVGIAQNW